MEPSPHNPLTKIVATVGPASSDPVILRRLIETGVSVFRLNFSHGDLDSHRVLVSDIRKVAQELGRPTAVMGDLQGPKIRVGRMQDGGLIIKAGDEVVFQRQACVARQGKHIRLSSTYDGLVDDARPGERLLINDGLIRMLIVDREPDALRCTVTVGGRVTSGKGINLPESTLTVSALSERDRECVAWAVENELDFLALSFVRTAQEVDDLRTLIGPPGIPVVAKIELPAAVERMDEIVDAADAIMVARGDLGVELELSRVPVVQKRLIRCAQSFGKPVIIATQMLESMVNAPTPTRAEASDVASAIFDETDAVMLSAETAVGSYPVLAVEHMRAVALQTEAFIASEPQKESPPQRLIESRYRTAALAHGVWTIAGDYGAQVVVVWSQSGGGARLLSQNNFSIPIVAISSDVAALRRMQLLRGVIPVHMDVPPSHAQLTRRVDAALIARGLAAAGDRCVLMAGAPLGMQGVTNAVALHEVGHIESGFHAF